jgi:hypothetical protein
MTTTCLTCGTAYGVGQWYQCPHDPVAGSLAADRAVTWPGGKTFENMAHEPQTFYSPSEHRAYCRAHRLEPYVRHVPVPGSDKSPHTTSWAAVSRTQLEAATALLERLGAAITITVTEAQGTVTEPIAGIHDAA